MPLWVSISAGWPSRMSCAWVSAICRAALSLAWINHLGDGGSGGHVLAHRHRGRQGLDNAGDAGLHMQIRFLLL